MGYVVFRLDDVQDGWLTEPQKALIELFLQHANGAIPLSLGFIGSSFNEKTIFLDYLRAAFSSRDNVLELVCHSLTHADFSTMDVAVQRHEINSFILKMKELFPEQRVSSFIPPFNRYTPSTVEFLKDYGIDVISGADGRYESKDLFSTPAFMHASITTNNSSGIDANFRPAPCVIDDIQKSLKSDTDWCVVMMHPQEFSVDIENKVDPQAISEMKTIIDWCLSSGHEILNMRQMRRKAISPEYAIKYFESAI